jgi:hypothetical protein
MDVYTEVIGRLHKVLPWALLMPRLLCNRVTWVRPVAQYQVHLHLGRLMVWLGKLHCACLLCWLRRQMCGLLSHHVM